ncbi:hypothetical protein GOODEAATRI_000343, partial [Goodea atripinnis]
ASRGQREHLTLQAREATVCPRLWFRFPKTPDTILTLHLSGAIRPPAKALSATRIYSSSHKSSLANYCCVQMPQCYRVLS